jgi:hypothetical protein
MALVVVVVTYMSAVQQESEGLRIVGRGAVERGWSPSGHSGSQNVSKSETRENERHTREHRSAGNPRCALVRRRCHERRDGNHRFVRGKTTKTEGRGRLGWKMASDRLMTGKDNKGPMNEGVSLSGQQQTREGGKRG